MSQQIGGDYVSGDKITIGNVTSSVVSIHQRALTAAEEAGIARDLERQSLAEGVQRLASSLRAQLDTSNTGIAPFKDLLPYELNDAEMFFGRQQAIQELLACLERGRLTVLHAESGAGKTSLLQAGVAPRLFAQGHLALPLRPGHVNPALVVRQAILPDPSSALGLAGAPLQAFLCRVGEILGPGCRLYLFLDQFEEFFRLEKDERSSFGRSLAQCLDDPGLDVRWAVALRAEAFSALAELEESGVAPFKNAYRLNRMGRDEARLAIQEPGRRAGLTFQPELVETLINDLGGKGDISPVQLSLVCSALSAGAAQNQPVTMQSLEKQGGVEGILRGYLQRQIGTLPPEQRDTARRVLRALVSADKRRTTKNISVLTGELIRQKISPPLLHDLLNRLVERRLVVAHESDAGVSYELAHDYLLGEIELDPAEQARKAAQELLDQEVRAYQRYGALIDAERLALIERYRAELQVSEVAGTLLAQSRAAVEQEAAEEQAQRQHELAQARRLAETRRQRAMVLAAGLVVAIFLAILSFSFWQQSDTNLEIAKTANKESAIHLSEANFSGTQAAQNLAAAQAQEANAKTQEAIANTQKGFAETQEAIAKKQAQIAMSRQLAAQAQIMIAEQFDLGLLLAIEASHGSNDGLLSLSGLLQAEPGLFRIISGADGYIWKDQDPETGFIANLTLSQDGNQLVAKGEGNPPPTMFWDLNTGQNQPLDAGEYNKKFEAWSLHQEPAPLEEAQFQVLDKERIREPTTKASNRKAFAACRTRPSAGGASGCASLIYVFEEEFRPLITPLASCSPAAASTDIRVNLKDGLFSISGLQTTDIKLYSVALDNKDANFGSEPAGVLYDHRHKWIVTAAAVERLYSELALIVWDLDEKKQVLELFIPLWDSQKAKLNFFNEGTAVDVCVEGGSGIRVDLNPDSWREKACKIAGRNFTPQEWAQYLGDEPYRATCPNLPAPTPGP